MPTHVLLYISKNNPDMIELGSFEELTPLYMRLATKLLGTRPLNGPSIPQWASTAQVGEDTVVLAPLKDGFWDRMNLGKKTLHELIEKNTKK